MHTRKLNKYYFIDNYNYTKLKSLSRDISLIWRSKDGQIDHDLINKIAIFCKKRKVKFFLANNFKLAIKLNLDGVYISAHNNNFRSNCFMLKKKFKIIGSAHNLYEIEIKKKQKVKEIFLSPVFKKKTNNPLGLYSLNSLFKAFAGKKIALGGVNSQNLKLLKLKNFDGFAGIEFFS